MRTMGAKALAELVRMSLPPPAGATRDPRVAKAAQLSTTKV